MSIKYQQKWLARDDQNESDIKNWKKKNSFVNIVEWPLLFIFNLFFFSFCGCFFFKFFFSVSIHLGIHMQLDRQSWTLPLVSIPRFNQTLNARRFNLATNWNSLTRSRVVSLYHIHIHLHPYCTRLLYLYISTRFIHTHRV